MLNLPSRYVPTGNSASGGFGRVIICQDTHLDRLVAIKSIKDSSERHRIIDELNALMQLRSKHVVQVYDRVIDDDGAIHIIEEYIDGQDLESITIAIPPSSSEKSLYQMGDNHLNIINDFSSISDSFTNSLPKNYLKTLWQIAAGIADIHCEGVIHRDIKPNNMKVDKEGIVKIFDFGLSKNSDENANTLGFKGTFRYAAPELYKYGYVEFTKAIDTYAFGITAIFLAGLPLPIELQKIPPQPISVISIPHLNDELLLSFGELIRNCLAFYPDDRPSMIDVRDKLANFLLKDKHQALAVHNNKPYIFNTEKRTVSLDMPDIGSLTIQYDGYRFFASKVNGEVYINNTPLLINQEIPKSSVITLGDSYRRSDRKYITFDVSNPEVVL